MHRTPVKSAQPDGGQEKYEEKGTKQNEFFCRIFLFLGNVELTPPQRLLELICVSVLAVLLAVVTAGVLYRKIKLFKAQQKTETESEHAD